MGKKIYRGAIVLLAMMLLASCTVDSWLDRLPGPDNTTRDNPDFLGSTYEEKYDSLLGIKEQITPVIPGIEIADREPSGEGEGEEQAPNAGNPIKGTYEGAAYTAEVYLDSKKNEWVVEAEVTSMTCGEYTVWGFTEKHYSDPNAEPAYIMFDLRVYGPDPTATVQEGGYPHNEAFDFYYLWEPETSAEDGSVSIHEFYRLNGSIIYYDGEIRNQPAKGPEEPMEPEIPDQETP